MLKNIKKLGKAYLVINGSVFLLSFFYSVISHIAA